MAKKRSDIPEEIKRQVRQDCHFGCIFCGNPIFDYDHIIDYSKELCHERHNLALLCPNHHRAKTNGKINIEEVKEKRLNPKNSSSTFAFNNDQLSQSKNLTIKIGEVSFSLQFFRRVPGHSLSIIWVNHVSLFTIHNENGKYTFSFVITDHNGRLALHVDRGEILVTTQAWDYTYEGKQIKIKNDNGDYIFNAILTDSCIEITHGAFVDPNGDGYIVDDGFVRTMVRNKFQPTMSIKDLILEGKSICFSLVNNSYLPIKELPWDYVVPYHIPPNPSTFTPLFANMHSKKYIQIIKLL